MHDSYCSCIFCSIRVSVILRCCGKNFLNKKFRVNSRKLESKPTQIFDVTPMTFRAKMIFSTDLVPLFFGSRTVWRWMKGADAAGCKSWINLANPIRATPWIGLSLTPNCSTRGRTSLASAILYAKVRMCRGQESLLSTPSPRFHGLRYCREIAGRYFLSASINLSELFPIEVQIIID